MFGSNALRAAGNGVRSSSTSSAHARLRIGYIPEHFSTPLFFAQKHYNLDAELISVPLGTGALASQLKDNQLDIAVGLTEGFVSDLAKTRAASEDAVYKLVGTYVQSPLCWTISTGAQRTDVTSVEDVRGKRVGVSRIGSGSYVMSYVLADSYGWLDHSSDKHAFEIIPIGDFAALRKSVIEKETEIFMWEHFTTKHYWDNGELKRIGEIYTPWPSWVIAARDSASQAVEDLLGKINMGVKHYHENKQEAVDLITSTMQYSPEDALEWMKSVRFTNDVRSVDVAMVGETMKVLRKAGVLKGEDVTPDEIISIKRHPAV